MTETGTVAGTALLVMLLAMWATRPPPSCEIGSEPRQRLNLERIVDREHLARDVRETERTVRRYLARATATSAGGNGPVTTPADSLADACRATLTRQLMTTHHVTIEQVRAAASPD